MRTKRVIKFKTFKRFKIDLVENLNTRTPAFDVIVNDGIADLGASKYFFKDLMEAEKYFGTFKGETHVIKPK